MIQRILAVLPAVVLAASVAACSRDYGFSRSAFSGKFVDKTDVAAIESAGKPARIEEPDPDTRVLVYERKTFNQETGNSKDALAKITFKKDASGRMMFSEIDFQSE